MTPRQTALGRLLQERRELAGFSRTGIAGLAEIKPGTIEGWELGRVAKPPIHDVLRLAHVLRISAAEIQRVVFEDIGGAPAFAEPSEGKDKRRASRRRRSEAVPLLEAAFRLFGWSDEGDAAQALGSSAEQVRRWRAGTERMELAEYLTLASMIGVAAAAAMKGDEARIADLSAAAEALGVRSSATAATAQS